MSIAPPMIEKAPEGMMPYGDPDEGTADLESRAVPAMGRMAEIKNAENPQPAEDAPSFGPPAEGQNPSTKPFVPQREAHHAKMHGLEESANAHRMAAAANADALSNLDVSDPDYYKKVLKLNNQQNDLHRAHGEIQQTIAEEKQANPWGTMGNHPGIGGKIGHAFGVLGNIAGNAVLGKENMAEIPGTQASLEKQGAEGQHEETQATENELKSAEAGKAEQKPEGKYVQAHGPDGKPLTHNGQPVFVNQSDPTDVVIGAPGQAATPAPTAGPADAAATPFYDKPVVDEPKAPVGPEGTTQHVNQLNTLTRGMDDQEKKDFLAAYSIKPTDTLAVATKRLEDAKAAAQLTGNERDRRMARDQAQRNHEEVMAVTAAARETTEGHKSKAENIKARQEVAKIYADPLASAERYNVMTANLRDAVQSHDQQAMLSLLTNHIGMTMGLQKGSRITQAILTEAQKSQPWLANVKASFDKDGYLSGVVLGPDQMKSMVNLARGRYREDVIKARNLGKYAGAEDDGPDRTPSESTMHYYLDLNKGDVNKAKQAAKADGWTV